MTTNPLKRFGEPIIHACRRPLSLGETFYVAAALFAFGTTYCQLYCAFSMVGMRMPITVSIWRSAIETIPALIGFEIAKRVTGWFHGGKALLGVGIVLLFSALLSDGLILVSHMLFYPVVMPARLLVADQIPGFTLTAAAIAWASVRSRENDRASRIREALAIMPPAQRIDWIQAAGNYVEVHVAGRTVLLRMTLHEAAAKVKPARFLQIHRSTIVNRNRIAGWDRPDRPRQVKLLDGTELAVGESYRGSLEH